MSTSILFASRFVTKMSTSLFAGNAMYCSLVEHKARMECGTRLAATEFSPSFKRAASIQGALASLGCIGGLTTYYYDRDNKWLAAAILMATILPYTLIFMMPVNYILLDPKNDKDSENTKYLLTKWGRLHAFRSLSSFIALVLVTL